MATRTLTVVATVNEVVDAFSTTEISASARPEIFEAMDGEASCSLVNASRISVGVSSNPAKEPTTTAAGASASTTK